MFGSIAYDVMDNLELALALRYDSEDREVSNNVPTCSASNPTGCHAQTPGFAYFYSVSVTSRTPSRTSTQPTW